jgi:crossover junction endodeoxyribonuclease RuvC
VLGIDPGTVVVGYGAVVRRPDGPRLLAAGVLRAPRGEAVENRLGIIRCEIDALIARLKPTVVVLEKAFSAVNVQSAFRIGEGRGVILASASCAGAEIVQYAPSVMKKALVGNGQADKTQVAKCVASELGLAVVPEPLDATDALGLALTYLFKVRLTEALGT